MINMRADASSSTHHQGGTNITTVKGWTVTVLFCVVFC